MAQYDRDEEDAIRLMIHRENEYITQRISWLTTIQGSALVVIGILLALLAVLSSIGALAALSDRIRYGRGIMFADVEILGMLTLLLGAAAGVLLWLGRRLVRCGRPRGS